MKVGSKISVTEFAFTNIHGGTGMSNWGHDEKFEGIANLIVTKVWDDYETGIKGWGEVNPKEKKLIEYLKRNCKQGYNKEIDNGKSYTEMVWVDVPGRFVVYWSQWNIVK